MKISRQDLQGIAESIEDLDQRITEHFKYVNGSLELEWQGYGNGPNYLVKLSGDQVEITKLKEKPPAD